MWGLKDCTPNQPTQFLHQVPEQQVLQTEPPKEQHWPVSGVQGEIQVTQVAITACSRVLGITLFPIMHVETFPPPGRVCSCINNWEHISDDHWILEVAKGYHLELACMPHPRTTLQERPLPESEQDIVLAEVTKLLVKQVIRKVKELPTQFLSVLFLVLKKDGSRCPVINLQPLNHYMQKQKFKMEGAKVITRKTTGWSPLT